MTELAPLTTACEINPRMNGSARPQEGELVAFVPMAAVDEDAGEIAEVAARPFREVAKGYTAFKSGDVLFAKITPCMQNGKAALVPKWEYPLGFGSTEFHVLRAREGVADPAYIYHFVRWDVFRQRAREAFTGTAGQQRVPQSFLEQVRIPLPPIEEQRRIAAALDRAARLVKLHKHAAAKTRDLIPALFIDMFGDPATNPKGWDEVEFGALIDTGPQNGLYKPASDYGDDGVPILRIDAFDSGWLTKGDKLRRVRLDADTISKFRLCEDDIVVNRVNSMPLLGKSVLIPPLNEPTVFESNMMRFTVQRELCCPRWAAVWLQLDHTRAVLRSKAKQAINQASLNQGDIRSLMLYLPKIEHQTRFAQIATGLVQDALTCASAVEHASALQNSLLSEVFGAA